MRFKNTLFKQANWTRSEYAPNSYQIEAAELEHTPEWKICPSCKAAMPALTPKKDRENEILFWRGTCPGCDAKLTIFND